MPRSLKPCLTDCNLAGRWCLQHPTTRKPTSTGGFYAEMAGIYHRRLSALPGRLPTLRQLTPAPTNSLKMTPAFQQVIFFTVVVIII